MINKNNRVQVLIGMFILLVLFGIFVFFYEKENIEVDVNTYYVPYRVKKDLIDDINGYKILGIIKNKEEHDKFIEAYDLYEDDYYLNYDFNYVHVVIEHNPCSEVISFSKIKKNDDRYELIFKDRLDCGYNCESDIIIYEIPIDKDVVDLSKLDVVIKYDDTNQVDCVDDVIIDDDLEAVDKKPVLYLYPLEDTMVNVKFENKDALLTTYPKYIDSWNVLAKKDGTLIDENGRSYYALYWDEKLDHKENFETGFYVKKEDSIKFLEEKLFEMGFTDREANEFIMYWLPIMERGGDNLVHFHFTEDREKQNKLYIEPKVDSLFRLLIEIKKVDKEVSIKEQKIEKFERYGFSALEWGGTVIK